VSDNFDFEGELAVVIGKAARHITAEQALDHVAGYTCFVDGSVRDYQKFSVTSGKNFPGTGPLGPWLVTTDEIPDPSRLTLTTRLNGMEVQHSPTDLLIYSIPQIIAFCSDFTALSPGDVIATGTPEGVGHSRKPPLWMKPGDTLEVEIAGIGTLRARVADERR
jgi:2-keto-4-pentenoate hydratase/2-oxohepta-3-ene-1,7-dioic acid hydratase in catechol pathway